MKIKFLFIVITGFCVQVLSESLPKKIFQAKWQQRVEYTIQVRLLESQKSLKGYERFVYYNQSPDTLYELALHLWPNAYSSKETPFAKQQLTNGTTAFHFCAESEMGWIDSLIPKVNGEFVKWQYGTEVEQAVVRLNLPLPPGKSLVFETPFYVKLPTTVFSRMGVEEDIFCLTQWYPKPAVYDANGWNTMSYLDQGEFYSEYGSFDVAITLPSSMICAATGRLQNEEEKAWLHDCEKYPGTANPAGSGEKTLRFVQDSIHDFAWFASKKFHVLSGKVISSKGKEIQTAVYYPVGSISNPEKALRYISEAVGFYSKHVGDYPYASVSVVSTPLESGAGMEYPMITNCATLDRSTIAHEVGHNWFYGILGSNERTYPWMDESINTFYENWLENEMPNAEGQLESFLLNSKAYQRYAYRFTARRNMDQAGGLPSEQYSDPNYAAIIYDKNARVFALLRNQMGEIKFDSFMQAYFQKWKYRHPLPGDFQAELNLFLKDSSNWFLKQLIGSDLKMDARFQKTRQGALIRSNAASQIPIPVSLFVKDSLVQTVWFNSNQVLEPKKFVLWNALSSGQQKRAVFSISQNEQPLETFGVNNYFKPTGWRHYTPPTTIQLLGDFEKSRKRQVFLCPIAGWNSYNNGMVGVAAYNTFTLWKRSEWMVAPLFSSITNDVNGYLSYQYNLFPLDKKVRRIEIGFKASRFGTNTLVIHGSEPFTQLPSGYTTLAHYEKIAPFVFLSLRPKQEKSGITENILARYVVVNEQGLGTGYLAHFEENTGISDLTYTRLNPKVLNPSFVKIDWQLGLHHSDINRLAAEIKQSILYKDGKHSAWLRFFGGAFVSKPSEGQSVVYANRTQLSYFQAAGTTGINDYLYDETMFGRREQSIGSGTNLAGRQILFRDAGFRNFVNIGSSNKWILAANLTVPMPIPLPIGFYADASYLPIVEFQNGVSSNKNQFNYIGGVYLAVAKNVFEIYLPLFASSQVETAWSTSNKTGVFDRVSFLLNLNALSPAKIFRLAEH